MANYWKLYKKAKTFYFGIGKIKCPALGGEEVIFDWRGFRHFLHKGRHKRLVRDQIRRFKLLFEIKKVISGANIVDCRDGEGKTALQPLLYKDDAKEIRIIVLRDKSGKKYFISIMNQT
jgi:hypothetical protein